MKLSGLRERPQPPSNFVSSLTASVTWVADRESGVLLRRREGQPRWVLPALVLIMACAVVLYGWGMSGSEYNSFYASAARSMAESWKAFLFRSFSPANAITIDKIPGYLWPQGLS